MDFDAQPMIEAIRLNKFYGNFAAIRDVSFRIPKSQVTAFLGPNGAGKSTTMKILTGLLSPASGSAKIAGFDVRTQRIEATRRLGYLPENGPLYPEMTPQSLLAFFGEARGLSGAKLRERMDEVISRCQLSTVIEKPIRKLSKGFRQRTGMAQALLHEPEVLILDEPTTGLDPNQIHEVRRLIRELGQNKSVLLSTHILQEVEAMADRVIFIFQGRIIFDGTPQEMKAGHPSLDEAFRAMTASTAEAPALA